MRRDIRDELGMGVGNVSRGMWVVRAVGRVGLEHRGVCGGQGGCRHGLRGSVRQSTGQRAVGQQDERVAGVRYASNGMWGVHAVGRGPGENGARGCVRCAGGLEV